MSTTHPDTGRRAIFAAVCTARKSSFKVQALSGDIPGVNPGCREGVSPAHNPQIASCAPQGGRGSGSDMRLSELIAICRREVAAVPDAAPGEAEILVSAVVGIPRSRLFLSAEADVGDAGERLSGLVARRAAGEPLQYVL